MLSSTSRYSNIYENKGTSSICVSLRNQVTSSAFIVHRAKENESFASLAADFLSNSSLYWRIADLNPQIPFPDRLPAGTQVRIPLA